MAIALLSLVALVPAARADQTIATVARPTPISAYGGRVVWSSYQPGRGFVLTTLVNGMVSEVPVAPRPVPFDADLGPAPNGGATVVYSRCRHEPTLHHGFPGNALTLLPEWQTGRGCDLYRFDFGSGRERHISRASTRRASEFLPSVWKGRLAFARVYQDRHRPAGKLATSTRDRSREWAARADCRRERVRRPGFARATRGAAGTCSSLAQRRSTSARAGSPSAGTRPTQATPPRPSTWTESAPTPTAGASSASARVRSRQAS